MIDGLWKVDEGESYSVVNVVRQGFLGGGSIGEAAGCGKAGSGRQDRLWGACCYLLRTLDFIL